MTTRAFRCDACRRYYSGVPACTVKVNGRTGERDGFGGPFVDLQHNAGVTDHDPELDPKVRMAWAGHAQKRQISLCVHCASRDDGPIRAVNHVVWNADGGDGE